MCKIEQDKFKSSSVLRMRMFLMIWLIFFYFVYLFIFVKRRHIICALNAGMRLHNLHCMCIFGRSYHFSGQIVVGQ